MSVEASPTVRSGPPVFPPSAGLTWRTGLTSAAVALVANVVVLGVARSAGADMLVQREAGEPAMSIGLGLVTAMTLVPMLAGTLLLLAVRRWGRRSWRALAILGLVVGLVTLPAPFTMLADTSTQVALALMHVVAGAAWFAVLRRTVARSVA